MPPDNCSTTRHVSRSLPLPSAAAAALCRKAGMVGASDRNDAVPTIDFRNSDVNRSCCTPQASRHHRTRDRPVSAHLVFRQRDDLIRQLAPSQIGRPAGITRDQSMQRCRVRPAQRRPAAAVAARNSACPRGLDPPCCRARAAGSSLPPSGPLLASRRSARFARPSMVAALIQCGSPDPTARRRWGIQILSQLRQRPRQAAMSAPATSNALTKPTRILDGALHAPAQGVVREEQVDAQHRFDDLSHVVLFAQHLGHRLINSSLGSSTSEISQRNSLRATRRGVGRLLQARSARCRRVSTGPPGPGLVWGRHRIRARSIASRPRSTNQPVNARAASRTSSSP